MRQDSKNPAQGMHQDEIALDGVRYANLHQAGQQWRIGAVSPAWRQELLALPANPDSNDLVRLEDRGLWIAPVRDGGVPPLAVMCCGLGSVWLGMGRELYDNFPVARAAMERLAAVADWDILGLMDETDVEKISLTRWQFPYVFMLEYAQWSVLASLGLSPTLFCGHSLGEMIGLCVSGMVEPEAAWYIIDTRAVHMGEMEARATRETGMMAVHADIDIINEACATWPGLYVSNYNTPHQFILSGPREVLQEARKSLRKRRIPAIVLNVSLAFHHPSMRVLRDISLRRLSALEMSPPTKPMLSCIDAQFYPGDPASTCTHIADLDENSVRWTESVHAMWNREGIRNFLELGPQDTLCSLVADNEPRAMCFSVGRKGREVEGMRQACARLYSLGYLAREAVEARVLSAGDESRLLAGKPAPHCGLRPFVPQSEAAAEKAEPSQPSVDACPATESDVAAAASYASSLAAVLQILAQASGRPVEDLRPEMDLRYDLALRSSRFPLIVQDVEKTLGISVNFEDLLQVSTVGDLARVLSGGTFAPSGKGEGAAQKVSATASQCAEPLRRFAPLTVLPASADNVCLEPLALAPHAAGLNLQAGDVLALCVLDATLLPRLLSGIAPLGCVLAVPHPLLDQCQPLAKAGARLVPLNINAAEWSDSAQAASQMQSAIAALAAAHGRVDGVLFVPPVPAGIMVASSEAQGCAMVAADLGDLLQAALDAAQPYGLRFASTVSVLPPAAENCIFDAAIDRVLDAARVEGFDVRGIRMLHGPERASLDEWGDMLARELLCGTAHSVIWARPGSLANSSASSLPDSVSGALPVSVMCHEPRPSQLICPCSDQFPLVFPDPVPPYRPTATLFQGSCHYSRFADTALATHGAQSGNALGATVPTLPACRSLSALLEGARQCLPWLTVTGFCDLRFFDAPELAPGVTRECRVTSEAEPWLMQEKVMTRMCHSTLSVRGLTPNGRHTAQYVPMCEGMVWLAAHHSEVRPLEIDMSVAGPAANCTPESTADVSGYYSAAGLGAEWHLVDNFAALPDTLYTARLSLPQQCIAPGLDSGYKDDMLVVEGVMQTAWLAITSEYSKHFDNTAAMAEALESWRLHAVGFIRIGAAPANGPLQVLMKRSWSAKRLRRFDAQVVDQTGTVFLTIHHLEFDRCDRAGLASALTPST